MLLSKGANRCPCKDCFDHTMTCHIFCKKYQEYRKRQDEIIKEKNELMQSTPFFSPQRKRKIWKEMKKR